MRKIIKSILHLVDVKIWGSKALISFILNIKKDFEYCFLLASGLPIQFCMIGLHIFISLFSAFPRSEFMSVFTSNNIMATWP
jgi:hypothetical protein